MYSSNKNAITTRTTIISVNTFFSLFSYSLSANCHIALKIFYHKETKMNIRKSIYWTLLGLFIVIFEKVVLAVLIAIAIYLGIAILKLLKQLKDTK